MSKKILSGVLAIAMLATMGSLCAVGASAEENDIKGGEITYRISKSWKYEDAKYYIHIWDGRENGKSLYKWQTKNELMTISEDGETATYNIPAGDWNLLILSESRGMQTFDTVFNQNCIGDTFTTIIDDYYEPVDDPNEPIIVWDNNPDCGFRCNIDGRNIRGHAYIPGENSQTMFDDFCEYYGEWVDGSLRWDNEWAHTLDIGWEDAKAYVASELGLSVTSTEVPTEVPTEESTDTSSENPTDKSNSSSNDTVNTLGILALVTLSVVLISVLGVTVILRKRKVNK